jgi:protein TonB
MFALENEPESRGRWPLLAAGAVVGCALFGVTLSWAAQLPPSAPKVRPDVIRMSVVRTPPKLPEAARLELPMPPREPRPTAQPKPEHKAPPKPAAKGLEPTAIATPEPLALGITLSSTTQSSRGPRFSVGDSLIGEPDRVAKAPRKARKIAGAQTATPGPDAATQSTSPNEHKESVAAELRRSVTPEYPASARRDGLEGVVVLAITIAADGRVERAQVIKGLGAGLDESAVRAARRTLWTPATLGGRPVDSTRRFNVRFTLSS